jgi:oligopeptide transport system ATP-binding protein
MVKDVTKMLNKNSVLERGAAEYMQILAKEQEIRHKKGMNTEEEEQYAAESKELKDAAVDTRNYIQTLDRHSKADQAEIAKCEKKLAEIDAKLKALEDRKNEAVKSRSAAYSNSEEAAEDAKELESLKAQRQQKISKADQQENPYGLKDEVIERNKILAYETLLSIGRYPLRSQISFMPKLRKAFRDAMKAGEDLRDQGVLNRIFQTCAFYVEYRSVDEEKKEVVGYAIIDCAHVKYTKDWQQIRGCKIATVFQDPMTSLNPVITIGKQIMTVVLKHQKCSQAEAKERTLDIMAKVGIPEPEKRFDDYPFQYSGGMRQRIVIAIALSCQPKILICDEPTTALDVTIQAQIIRLIKDLQRELGFTTVYITHDLGVVANVAERVAVLYAGQIVELGTVEEIFYDPKHPYTWALLSSLPQLTERGTDLFSIPGTPPSLYNKIVGDAFAPRNQYAMGIDLKEEPPMFQVSDTHFAKTWLLDPRAPKTEAPKNIQNLHEKMVQIYGDFEGEGE